MIIDIIVDVILIPILIGLVHLPITLLRYNSEELEVTDEGVNVKRGIFSSQVTHIPFSKINSLTTKRGLGGNLLGYGDIIILTGNDIAGIPFSGIENPEGVRAYIMGKMKK